MNATVKNKTELEKKQGLFSFKNRWMEVSVWLGVIVGTYIIIQCAVLLHGKYQQMAHPESLIYGTWMEKDVAHYQADRLLVNQSGIIIEGGVVDTDFQFDGDYLVYQHGNQERRFKFEFENWNEMTLEVDGAYQPVFVKTSLN
ncbi:DUF2850 domain-containing protein [Vibrio kasasachensis]|uniref:DUF2850 domain-containing protein n=1 Tax=Vibrio kasasachensis TaxID=2910248 RepID=UPI003D0C13FB